ncbi:mRNA export factor GLE1 [Periophthalmus magnuspinnatus]|uniref:mRNA export factor GLE1 n=1 Tax=Periophthalmus magnuspinnatus TaxID=409849 RepID=UPI00145BABD5|nr:mRNA export factor GLE1 [Periophthalmus magnuspinnatus]
MQSDSLRWETIEALKNSPKGKLHYDPHWSERGEDILAGYQESPSLSSYSAPVVERLNSLQIHKSRLSSVSGGSSPGFSEDVHNSFSSCSIFSLNNRNNNGLSTVSSASPIKQDMEQVVSEPSTEPVPFAEAVLSPPPTSGLLLVSCKEIKTAGQIIRFQEETREKAKLAVRQRQEEQDKLVAAVVSSETEQLKRFEELMELKQRQDLQSVQDMMDRETKESIGRQEKLKEEQRHRTKILNLRLREAEQQRLREAELERQRQAEGRERLRTLNSIQEEVLQLNQVLNQALNTPKDPKDPSAQVLVQSLAVLCQRGNQLCSQVSEVVRKTAEGDFPSVEDMTIAERALHNMRALIHQQQEEVNRAEEKKKKEAELEEQRKKEAEQKAKQEAEKKAAEAAKEKAKRTGLQSVPEDSTLKWFKELQDSADAVAQSFEELSSTKDAKLKKLKLNLMKASVIPVSQISTNSGSSLRDIFDKIDKLLSGKTVQSGGMSVSTTHHPQGRQFACYKLAEKFVKQGEEEVASHFEAAFPIAAVASGIWEQHPIVGDLFLAHLHRKCPFSIPFNPRRKDADSDLEHHRMMGYRVDESSGLETDDSFLKRMSGMIRLYAAIIQLRWPYGSQQTPAPHGLNHGWRWLAQMLNMEPQKDTTATLLFDFLEVCGNALVKQYQGQFWKLLLFLKEEYFPRIKAATKDGQMGSLTRLEKFLETSLRSRQISPPKGQLTSAFWRS